MKIRIGSLPGGSPASSPPEDYHRITGPGPRASMTLAVGAGLLIFAFPCSLLSAVSTLVPRVYVDPADYEPFPWLAVAVTLFLTIPVHELLHAVCHPHAGLSDATLLVIWPKRIQFGVYFEGCMSRTRWLVMRLFPFCALTFLPLIALLVLYGYRVPWAWEVCLTVLFMVNSLSSGADVAAALLVLRQVPPDGQLCFVQGRAYWKAAQCASLC